MREEFIFNQLPNLQREDAGFVLMSEWKVNGRELQKQAVDAAMQVWEKFQWPEGLLSYSCYLGDDYTTILHYSQWKNEEAHTLFLQNDPPERINKLLQSLPIKRHRLDTLKLHRSVLKNQYTPGCIVVVREKFDTPDFTISFINKICDVIESSNAGWEGLISAHFHIDLQGTLMTNYAAWTSARAHQEFLVESDSSDSTLAELKKYRSGKSDTPVSGSVDRFTFYKSIIKK